MKSPPLSTQGARTQSYQQPTYEFAGRQSVQTLPQYQGLLLQPQPLHSGQGSYAGKNLLQAQSKQYMAASLGAHHSAPKRRQQHGASP